MGQTGDGSRVGLFIRLPQDYAGLYPDISSEDDSPRHITFLTGLSVEPGGKKEKLLLECCRRAFSTLPSPVTASVRDLDFFLNPKKMQTIHYSPVRFSADLKKARWDLQDLLVYNGFTISDVNPLVYQPHVTLEYGLGLFSTYKGPEPPRIRFDFDHIEVWGLPKIQKIALGTPAGD